VHTIRASVDWGHTLGTQAISDVISSHLIAEARQGEGSRKSGRDGDAIRQLQGRRSHLMMTALLVGSRTYLDVRCLIFPSDGYATDRAETEVGGIAFVCIPNRLHLKAKPQT
jgi:hypothetical protein